MDGDAFQHTVAAIDASALRFAPPNGTLPQLLPRRLGLAALAAPAVQALHRKSSFDLLHAWGPDAAAAARAALPETPLAVTIFNPGIDDRAVRILRTIASDARFGVACTAERVARRLVERGLPHELCAILRPGVDFALLGRQQRPAMRQQLDIPPDCRVVLTPEARDESHGHQAVVWSAMMRRYLDEPIHVIVPGESCHQRDLAALVKSSEAPGVALFTGCQFPYETLLCAADYLVLAGDGECSTTAIAWAMAASVPVIAPATYAVTELLANDLNAILFKPHSRWSRTGAHICALYDRTETLPRIKEAARGQAYEVFSLRRMVRQYQQLYDNLLAGQAPSHEIRDPALTSP